MKASTVAALIVMLIVIAVGLLFVRHEHASVDTGAATVGTNKPDAHVSVRLEQRALSDRMLPLTSVSQVPDATLGKTLRSSRLFVGWLGSGIHRKVFPEQNAERPTYDETAKGPITFASMIGNAHAAWPNEGVAVVHGAAMEVVTGLLHRPDIEVGQFVGQQFMPLQIKPWEAAEMIGTELKSRIVFFPTERATCSAGSSDKPS